MRSVVLSILFFVLPTFAWAHPHIWVYTTIEVLTQNEKITALKMQWNFDEMYSSAFMLDADHNKNGLLDKNEALIVANTVFGKDNTDLNKFFHTQLGGKKQNFTFHNAKVWMEDESLHYAFTIIFDEAPNVNGKHNFAVYDPEFYVAFEQDFDLILPEGTNCSQFLEEDESISLYDGLVHPEIYTLTCS